MREDKEEVDEPFPYLQLISEIVWVVWRLERVVSVGQALLALLRLPQLSQHRLQAGLEGVDLL